MGIQFSKEDHDHDRMAAGANPADPCPRPQFAQLENNLEGRETLSEFRDRLGAFGKKPSR
jgi:hypothetical protein